MDEHPGYGKSVRSGNEGYLIRYKHKQVNSRYVSMEIEISQTVYPLLCVRLSNNAGRISL